MLGYAIFDGVRSLDLGFLAWEDAGPYVAGGVILGAGLYQLTAPKDACLRHCRSPAMLLESAGTPAASARCGWGSSTAASASAAAGG